MDALFRSVVDTAIHPVAVVLSGEIDCGTKGIEAFIQNGLPVLVQDPDTCPAEEMPRAALAAAPALPTIGWRQIAGNLSALPAATVR